MLTCSCVSGVKIAHLKHTHMSTSTEENESAESPTKPRFKGCVFCYSAEWAYYGLKRGLNTVRD